jgi:hypothetical protein
VTAAATKPGWLAQVNVSSYLQADHEIELRATGGQHDHRDREVALDLAANFQAVEAMELRHSRCEDVGAGSRCRPFQRGDKAQERLPFKSLLTAELRCIVSNVAADGNRLLRDESSSFDARVDATAAAGKEPRAHGLPIGDRGGVQGTGSR